MSAFPANLEGFNEADVREEIIAPLLRYLGYKAGSQANIIRELDLRYPRRSLGRKKPATDPPLRGRADYVLETPQRIRWTVETKPPTSPITVDDVEQAYSYATHPEIRAVLFVVTNGLEFRVYQTNRGPGKSPALSVPLQQLDAHRLRSVLSPEAIQENYPDFAPDIGPPLADGLRSIARITGGSACFDSCVPDLPLLLDLNWTVVGGTIQRNDEGAVTLVVRTAPPFRPAQTLLETLGLETLDLSSTAPFLSADPSAPTTLRQELFATVPSRALLSFAQTGHDATLLTPWSVESLIQADGFLAGRVFQGKLAIRTTYSGVSDLDDQFTIRLRGRFTLSLS